MITIDSQVGYVDSEFFVIDLGFEPVKINFKQQIDDLMISSPDGDILITWDVDGEFNEKECMLIKTFDNLKEIGNIKSTFIVLRTKTDLGKTIPVWLVGQRN